MKSAIIKRSIKLNGRKTSVSLEDEFWNGLLAVAASKKMTPTALLRTIPFDRGTSNLSSAIRVFVLNQYRERAAELPAAPTRSMAQERPFPQQTAVKALNA